MSPKYKYEYLLLAIAVLWAILFSSVLQLYPGFSPVGDDGSYLYSARLLYYTGSIDSTRPLLISAVHGLPYAFGFADSGVVKWGILVNFSCWWFTALLLFQLAASLTDRKRAFFIALFFVFTIGNLAYAFNFLSESLYIFLLVLSVYLIRRYYQTGKVYFITLSIAVLLFNVLIKPVAMGLVLLMLLFFIRSMAKIVFNKYAIVLGIGVFLIGFQMYSLKRQYGDYVVSYISSPTYYNYLGTKADCYAKDIEYDPLTNKRIKVFWKKSYHEMKEIAARDFEFQARNNTVNLAKAYLFCMYSNSSKGNYIVSECKNVKETAYFPFFKFLFKALSKLQNIIFTVAAVLLSGFTILRYKRQKPLNVVVALFILYTFFVSALSCYQSDRFHIVFFPLLFVLMIELKKGRE